VTMQALYNERRMWIATHFKHVFWQNNPINTKKWEQELNGKSRIC
jgi:hypothetical protein